MVAICSSEFLNIIWQDAIFAWANSVPAVPAALVLVVLVVPAALVLVVLVVPAALVLVVPAVLVAALVLVVPAVLVAALVLVVAAVVLGGISEIGLSEQIIVEKAECNYLCAGVYKRRDN